MKPPQHEMILASAGSGKTYALTNRFVQLLALGAKPQRIVALTFTRKAAGEFFDDILNKLARAATEERFAAKIAGEIGISGADPAEFRGWLRAVVAAMPQLTLGTFDAFFARIVRSFPLELGLAGDFEVLEEHPARLERQRVLRRMFAHTGREPSAAQREFIEAFKRATFGTEEKQLARRLDSFLDRHQNLYLNAPDGSVWGNPVRIWPEGSFWLGGEDAAPAAATTLQALLAARADLHEGQRERFAAFFAELPGWSPGAPLPTAMNNLVGNALRIWPDLLAGDAELTVDRRKLALNSDECAALVAIVRGVVGAELTRRLEITRGIHAVLQGYEGVYHDTVRRAGRLTFADVQRLLMPESGAPRLSATTADADDRLAHDERRLLIDWRLDARFEHWLLDEFQDTSAGQWSVLRNLIDEVVQDDSRRRTFFYVGDVKQAIYGWREGDARLFREIYHHYNRHGPLPAGESRAQDVIKESRLDQSRRSAPAILELVNRVFRDARRLGVCSLEAAARWAQEWQDHESVHPEMSAQAAWLEADDEPARFATTLALLQQIRPLERGLTAAVLTQRNETATQLADFLRATGGLPAVAESDEHVGTDNPLAAALLSLLQAAAHPGDTLAWEHLHMTPLRSVLEAKALRSRDALTRDLLRQIHDEGFERTLERWLGELEPHLATDDAFSRERARQLAEAARLFDVTGSRDVAEFLQFVQRHTVREADPPSVVRVTTIHKAKGLGFDVVILPDLQGNRLASRREGLAVHRNPDRSVSWILDLPPRIFHERDEVLAAHVREEEAEACYEEFARLYVAVTRAKRGLYLITDPLGRSESLNFPRLLTETLGGELRAIQVGAGIFRGRFSHGDPNWFAGVAPPPPGEPERPLPGFVAETWVRTSRRPAVTPSRLQHEMIPGAALFADPGNRAEAFGTAVHSALAAVEWWFPLQLPIWRAQWQQARLDPAAIAEAEACLEAPALLEVFTPPRAAGTQVWRERAFEILLDGAWVSGVFDRLVVSRDARGRATGAQVYDFKTDRFGTGRAELGRVLRRYAEQLRLYQRAAAVLLGLRPEVVSCALVFTGAVDAAGQRLPPAKLP